MGFFLVSFQKFIFFWFSNLENAKVVNDYYKIKWLQRAEINVIDELQQTNTNECLNIFNDSFFLFV